MVLMHDVVAHREVGAALDALPPGRERAAGAFFLLAADELRVGQHGQAQARIFHARGDRPDADAAASRRGQLAQRVLDFGGNAVVFEKVPQHAGAALVARQHQHAVILFEIEPHVLGGGLRVAGIGGQLLGRDARERARRQRPAADGEGVGHVYGVLSQSVQKLVKAEQKAVRRHGDEPAAVQLPDVLAELPGIVPCPLGAAAGLIQQHDRVAWDIIRGAGHGIDQRQIPVRLRQGPGVHQPIGVAAQGLAKPGRVLAAAALSVALGPGCDLAPEHARPARGQGWQSLGGGQDHAAFDLLGAALARRVKAAHGIDLVPPELHTDRLVVRRRKEVQDAAAAGELSRSLHLLRAGIAAAQQRVLHILDGAAAPVREREGGRGERLGRQGALQQTGYGDDRELRRAAPQRVERGDAPLLGLPRDGLGRVKDKVPQPQRHDLFSRKSAQVRGHALRRRIVRADDENGTARRLPQRGGQMRPVHGGKPGNERRKSSALQQTGEGGGFLIGEEFI